MDIQIQRNMKRLLYLGCLLIWTFPKVQANGIELWLYGHRLSGMGYIGSGLSLDASSTVFNPATLAGLKNSYFQLGGTAVLSNTTFLAETPSVYTASAERFPPLTSIYFHAAWRGPSPQWAIGVSLINPFVNQTSWPDDWKGRFIVQEASTSIFYVQTSFSFKVSEQVNFGASLIYGLSNFLSRRALPFSSINNTEGAAELSGTGNGWGYQLGIYFRPSYQVSFGISYRSEVKLKIDDGSAIFAVPNSLQEVYPNTSFTSEISAPSMLSMGLGYYPTPDVTFGIDLRFIHWNIQDTVSIDYTDNTIELEDEISAKGLENSISFHIGGEYELNDTWAFRLGAFYNSSPVQAGFLSPEAPDADLIGFTGGLGIRLIRGLNIDFSYAYDFTGERTGILEEAGFGGTYDRTASTLGVGLTYKF